MPQLHPAPSRLWWSSPGIWRASAIWIPLDFQWQCVHYGSPWAADHSVFWPLWGNLEPCGNVKKLAFKCNCSFRSSGACIAGGWSQELCRKRDLKCWKSKADDIGCCGHPICACMQLMEYIEYTGFSCQETSEHQFHTTRMWFWTMQARWKHLALALHLAGKHSDVLMEQGQWKCNTWGRVMWKCTQVL